MSKVVIETARLTLRFIELREVDLVVDFLAKNESHFQESSPKFAQNYLSREYQLLRLDHDKSNREKGVAFRFWISPKSEPNKLLGDVHFNQIIRGGFQSCFVGYKIGAEHCNQGIMTESLEAACKHIFDQQGLHRVEANIMPRNLASQKVVEKVGFQNEGRAIKFLKINGKWEDHFRYALLNEQLEK